MVRGPFTEGNEAPSEEDFIEIHLGKVSEIVPENVTCVYELRMVG